MRTALILRGAASALLGGGLWAGWKYTQSQYYVGVTDDGQVAVFQGVPGQIAGFDLSSVHYDQHDHASTTSPRSRRTRSSRASRPTAEPTRSAGSPS